jgi:putative FmdB family regulatory protein
MPIYLYRCEICEHTEEIIEKYSENAVGNNCPKCNNQKFNRTITGTNFALKGGGWYKDGYSSKAQPSRGENND